MARVTRKSVGHSPQYQEHDALARELNEKSDCAVRAISVACGVSYEVVREKLAEKGRKSRQGTRTPAISEVIQELGREVNEIPYHQVFILRYPGKHANKIHITTHHPDRFPEVWGDGRTYLFFTSGHVLCVKNGVNHDWTRGTSKRVQMIWEVR